MGATAPCNIRQQPQRPEKGEKSLFCGWGGGELAPSLLRRSCLHRAGFPGRGELWALPWPRGAAGALSHPAAPCSTLQHPAPVRACAAVPGCTEPIFGDQSGGDAAWEGRHVPSRGGTPMTPGTAGSKSLLHGAVGKAAAGSAGAAGISLALARSVLISMERRRWQDCSLISLAIGS